MNCGCCTWCGPWIEYWYKSFSRQYMQSCTSLTVVYFVLPFIFTQYKTKHTKTYSTYMSLYPLLSHTLSFWWLKSSNFVWVILLEFNIFFAAIHQSMIYWLKIILEDGMHTSFPSQLNFTLHSLVSYDRCSESGFFFNCKSLQSSWFIHHYLF